MDRLLKGLKYFRSIKPSEFNASHKAHLNLFLNLVEEHITGKEVKTRKVKELEPEDIFV